MRACSALVALVLLGCDAEPLPAAPRDPDALQAWLVDTRYADWEPMAPVREAENGGGVRVFLGPTLADSLADGREVHPAGAAAVREIYEPDLVTLRGWSALVKLEDVGAPDADAWLWFEVFGTTMDVRPLVAEPGATGCITCHDEGVDFVRSGLD